MVKSAPPLPGDREGAAVEIALEEKRSELRAVLNSKDFIRCPALAKLLEYLCEKTFSGHVQEIKEFSIATEVFGRGQGFGEKRDSVVRVEVHRLRKKLQSYYETEGASHPVRILLKPGIYQPEFERITDFSAEAAPAGDGISQVETPAAPPFPAPLPAHTSARRLGWWITSSAAAVLLATVGLAAVRLSLNRAGDSPAPPSRVIPVPAAGPIPLPVRILAGSKPEKSVDRFGVEWLGDRYFTGGDPDTLRFGSQERLVAHPIIFGAPDQTPFRNFRAGQFSYRIPLPAAKYELRLYFSEVVLGMADSGDGPENQRIFDVDMNGQPLLRFFDMFSEAGASDTADIRVFENVTPGPDGFLKLDFRPVRDAAWLNAIELIPNDTGRAFPLRICARNANFTDHTGNLWGADRYFVGGKGTSDGKVPAGTSDPDLFMGLRYGHFSYRLPVPPGRYKLRLLFAETFFGPDNRGKGGVGSRVFNVYCSGAAILRQFDIFKEAGENRALEKVFHGITPNPAGRIDLTFEPSVNYAVVQAIELTPDDGK